MERVIRSCTNPGNLVLDPMCGSGTAPAVAKRLVRNYIGIELSQEYAEAARERCRETLASA